MSVDITLAIDTIQGESVVKNHWGEIDVVSFSWGLELNGVYRERDGGGRADVSVEDMTLVKYADLATPALKLALARGERFSEVTLSLRKAGRSPLDYLVYVLKDVMVSESRISGSTGDDRILETIALTFREVQETYRLQGSDGSALERRVFSYKLPDNTPS